MNSTNITNYVNITPTPPPQQAEFEYADEPEISKIIRYIIYCILFILAVGGNIAVVSVPIRHKRMRNFTYFLITNLAVSDIGTMLCLPPLLVSDYYNLQWPMGEVMCKLVNPSLTMFSIITTNSLVAIAVDRFMALVFPFKRRPNVKESALVISLTWLLAFGVVLPSFGARRVIPYQQGNKVELYCREFFPADSPEEQAVIERTYNISMYMINNALPIVIISAVYAIIITKLKGISFTKIFKRKTSKGDSNNGMAKPITLTSDEFYQKQKTEREKKFMKMLLSVVVVFVLFYVPVQTYFLIIMLGVQNNWKYTVILYQYLFLMMWVPNALNPILYGSMNEQYAKAFKRIFRCKGGGGNDLIGSTTRGSYSKAPMTMQSRNDDTIYAVNRGTQQTDVM